MRIIFFCQSLLSDWNHGNAHFLRGVASELMARDHEVIAYEPRNAWSVQNLICDCGTAPLAAFRAAYPHLRIVRYDPRRLDLDAALDGADLVLVHEWNPHELVAAIGRHRARTRRYRLLFHDTHHRAVSDPESVAAYDLREYDGVLAFGAVLSERYIENGWALQAWTWHEAADIGMFRPVPAARPAGDLVWIGNWGDNERTAELREYLIEPVLELNLRAAVYGVRYPAAARTALRQAGIEYRGWLPNFQVPAVFGQHAATVHIPRRPYVTALRGVPTIRMFEALACAIPLVCSPWDDTEGLFTPGRDYLVARTGREMTAHLRLLLENRAFAAALAAHGRRTVLARHTCAHRAEELLGIYAELEAAAPVVKIVLGGSGGR